MNTKRKALNKISITQLIGGNSVAMQIYGPHSLDEHGAIIPFEEQLAIVSHYIHNKGGKYAKTYQSKAEGLIEDIYNIHEIQPEGNQFLS